MSMPFTRVGGRAARRSRRVRRGVVAAVLPFALLAILAAPVLAVPSGTLDQHNNTTAGATGNSEGGQTAQTFTAGKTGKLTYLRLYCMGYGGPQPGYDATVDLYATAAGVPSTKVATSETSTASSSCDSSGTWVDYVFATPPSVTSGTVYAIVMGGLSKWGRDSTNAYAAGRQCDRAEGWACSAVNDYLFETYVDPAATAAPTATVKVPTQPPTDAIPAAGAATGGTGTLLIGFALAAVVAAVALAVPVRRRGSRRR